MFADVAAAAERYFPDGSCPPEVEAAAKVSFELDPGRPAVAWEELAEEDRSFHRRVAVCITATWYGQLLVARAGKVSN
jgi:hypothetical protein